MKTETLRMVRVSVVSAALLVGLGHSILALTLTSKPAYASSCNCTEEIQDAKAFCESQFGSPTVRWFDCPTSNNSYLVRCEADPNGVTYAFYCD
jgi:hypothetical protein